ncbi:hypothetical protein [Tetragenococcus solitarius]|uniref:DUF4352 domain-containing protein n=1 Tax=Tetragenococcus solitarius TaxID=71453 RepID=A0ABN3Y056_9ENTE|nr:hypothetical protein [Tetragenococcus solitarius]
MKNKQLLKKIILLAGISFVIAGCGNQENTAKTDETSVSTTEESKAADKPDFNSMSKEEINAFFEDKTVEEIQELTADMAPSELVDKDGNEVEFPEEAYQNSLNAGWDTDFNMEELGSGVNPAGVEDKVVREVDVYDAFGEMDEDGPVTEPGTFEITLLSMTRGDQAWDILSSDELNRGIAEEPTDFDYVIAEFELNLVEGPEYGMVMPVVNGTTDQEGNKLFEPELLPIPEKPLATPEDSGEINGEVALIHKGEKVTGELVAKLPKDEQALVELNYNGDNYLFFESN